MPVKNRTILFGETHARMTREKEENSKKTSKTVKSSGKSKSFFSDERIKFVFGILITGFALYLLLACVSYLFWWKTDLSLPGKDVISGPEIEVKNWAGKSGFWLSDLIIAFGFGYGAFFLPLIFGSIGLYLLNFPKIRLWSLIAKFTFAAIILSLILGYIFRRSRRLFKKRTWRGTGISDYQMAECLYGEDRHRCASCFFNSFISYFCIEI